MSFNYNDFLKPKKASPVNVRAAMTADKKASSSIPFRISYGSSGLPNYITDSIKSSTSKPSSVNVREAMQQDKKASQPAIRNIQPRTAAGPRPGSVVDMVTRPKKESTTTPVKTTPTPGSSGPVQITPEESEPIYSAPAPAPAYSAPEPEPEPTPYNVYDDPNYQAALNAAQSDFNLQRIDAMGSKQYQEMGLNRALEQRPEAAEDIRQRLAGNYASRGMGGGRAGALTRAEADVNAREVTARTGLREQMAELDRQFTSNFGAEGSDWLGTRIGQQAQQNAIQQALAGRLGGLTTV